MEDAVCRLNLDMNDRLHDTRNDRGRYGYSHNYKYGYGYGYGCGYDYDSKKK